MTELRELLFSSREDQEKLESICREHRQQILAEFRGWLTVPEEMRNEPETVQRYGTGMIAVAQCFSESLNDSTLIDLLRPADNPLDKVGALIRAADTCIRQLEFHQAIQLVQQGLEMLDTLSGEGAESFRPILLGRMAESCFAMGDMQTAEKANRAALEHCAQAGDGDGVLAYVGNLYEVYRYKGDAEAAAHYCEQLAKLLEQHDPKRSARYHRQAQRVREGEPLNRMVAQLDGVTYEVEDVPVPVQGSVNFVFQRNRLTLRPAFVWCERGKQLGAEGQLEEALRAFEQASRFDPHCPDPHYQIGFTLLHLGRFAEAADAFSKTEQLAPGWYQCRSDRWYAERLASGALKQEVVLVLLALEDHRGSAEEQVAALERLDPSARELPAYHLLRGKATKDKSCYRKGLELVEEPELETRLLVALGGLTEDRELLQRAAELNGHLMSGAAARLILRQMSGPEA